MPATKYDSIRRTEQKDKVTYPKAWCERCMEIFMVKKDSGTIYHRCTNCKSTAKSRLILHPVTNNKEYFEIRNAFREKKTKGIALCPSCQHLWKMNLTKRHKKTECSRCGYIHKHGKYFIEYFRIRLRDDIQDKLYLKFRQKFPKDFSIISYEGRKEDLRLMLLEHEKFIRGEKINLWEK